MALVVDVKADLALFRKPYTTTSMVSYPFPPPTAVAGLLAAIVGLPHGSEEQAQKANFWEAMEGTRIALGLRAPLTWITTAVNLMKFKSASADMGEHIRVKHQYVKNPRYRIYVDGGKIYSSLKDKLSRGEQVFTPYLGVAYALAEVEYHGEEEACPLYGETEYELDTVLPHYGDVEVDVLKSQGVHKETVPFKMDQNRRLQNTVTVYYPDFRKETGDIPRLFLKNQGEVELSQVGKEKVAWFYAW